MDARQKALWGIDLSKSSGVEIGPLTRPLVRKDEADVYYIDRASTHELRSYYASAGSHIDPASIVDIDFVWGDLTLSECVGRRRFDWCFAGHVVEHVPDLVTWLTEVEQILYPGGVLSLIVPDRRYTFDYLRRTSTISEAVEAHLLRLRRPNCRQVFDHFANFVEVDTARMWTSEQYRATLKPNLDLAFAVKAARQSLGDYIDTHCWVFTTESFRGLFDQIRQLGLVGLVIDRLDEPAVGTNEFFATLRRT
jgi:SAM-dependent methyltransferase